LKSTAKINANAKQESPASALGGVAADSPEAGIAAELASSLRRLFAEIPDVRRRPSALATHLGVSRVLISRTLGAIALPNPLDMLQRVPGPETLRGIVEAAVTKGAPQTTADAAIDAIEQFSRIIRDSFGTRAALNAAICANQPDMQRRLELDSRYRVFKGMRELRGVEAATWLSTTFVAPNHDNPAMLSATVLQGFIALRRLRNDVPVNFAFDSIGAVANAHTNAVDVPASTLSLEDLYTHKPAVLDVDTIGGKMMYRLRQSGLGKHALTDMLAMVRVPEWRSRFARPDRPLVGPFAQPTAPVKLLVFDLLAPAGTFTEESPLLSVYAPSMRGAANPNDAWRDIDRASVPETVEIYKPGEQSFEMPEIPNYRHMLTRVAGEMRLDLDALQLYRVRMAYPVFGFQFVISLQLPPSPAPIE
jgi:hypothetical protein